MLTQTTLFLKLITAGKISIMLEKDGSRKGKLSAHHTFNMHTDCYKMEEGVGAAVFSKELGCKQSYKLPDYCSVSPVEIYAVKKAADLVIESTPQTLHKENTSCNDKLTLRMSMPEQDR